MPYTTDEDRVRHEAELRREEIIWQSHHIHMLASDRAAVDLGVSALKTAVLINAGAIVALLAFVAQVWKTDHEIAKQVLLASSYYFYGLASAATAFIIAYFYQSFVTASFWPALDKMPLSEDKVPHFISVGINDTKKIMIGLSIASLVCFIIASMKILNIFTGSV